MKKSIISLLALLIMGSAQAEVFSCVFTEPFISFKFDTTTNKFIATDDVMTSVDPTTPLLADISNARLEITGVNKMNIVGENDELIAQLTVDYQGSDGMSDYIYPISVVWGSVEEGMATMHGGIGLHGGCTTTKLKSTLFDYEAN